VPATLFLGRARELVELSALLESDGTRLLTLTGAGGSGKTRLALRLAEVVARDYREGTWFVGFADIADPQMIVPTVCQALELAEQRGRTPVERLREWFGERELLLVMDNLEQLVEGVVVLGELLASCPGLTLLTTSREPLHLAGEQQYEVPVLAHAEAIELFKARAHAVKPGIEIDSATAGAICERLDCLPLAIELAAARTSLLSAAEIRSRLDARLPLLTGGPRDAPRRQRTLSATIDWSHDLLDAEERRLFARLAVFAGCTLAAAQAVCGARLDTLQALVDRSLVRTDGERYWMLQTLREYALERLEQTGEANELRGAHAEWLIGLLDAEVVDAHAPASPSTWNRVAPERENFRAALDWAFSCGDTETVARLAAPLRSAWWHPQGLMQEAGRWLGIALEHLDDYAPSLAGAVLRAARWQAFNRGEYAQGAALAEQGLAIWRELGDQDAATTEAMWIGNAATMRGDYSTARAVLEETIRLAREHDLPRLLCPALGNLSYVSFLEGNLDEARALEEEAVGVGGGTESVTGTLALLSLSHLEILDGHHHEAEELAREALKASLLRGHLVTVARAAMMIAWSLAEQGELERPGRLIGAAAAFLEQAGVVDDGTQEDSEPAVLAALHAQLDDQAIQALLDEGRSMSVEEALHDPEPTTTRVVQPRPYGPSPRRANPTPRRNDKR
jgi:predicted ATPase